MRRTTVYLTDEELDLLKRAALRTGRSQSALIRDGIRRVSGSSVRRFASEGVGEGTGEAVGRNFDEYLTQRLGAVRDTGS